MFTTILSQFCEYSRYDHEFRNFTTQTLLSDFGKFRFVKFRSVPVFISLRVVSFCFDKFRFILFRSVAFRFVSFRSVLFRFVPFCFVSLRFVSVNFVSFHFACFVSRFISHFTSTPLANTFRREVLLIILRSPVITWPVGL